MGHRALVGRTQLDGKVKYFYAHWGALNAYEAGGKKPEAPSEDAEDAKESDYMWADNRIEFGKAIDYLHHEAVWLDGVCYCPIWIFPSESVDVASWKTEGQGVLIRCKSGIEFNAVNSTFSLIKTIDSLTALSTEDKIMLMVNEIVGHTYRDNIPEFSPLGYNHKYENTKGLYNKLKNKPKANILTNRTVWRV